MSPRRCMVLISQLPPGSRLLRAMGGHGAWTDAVSAIHHEGQRIVSAVLAGAGAKQAQIPKPVEPPKAGWQAEAVEREQKTQAKAERWLARQEARASNE